jgi:tocopherol O-methyltransferase
MIHSTTAQPPSAVADHYDELDPIYRQLWGEHVHHGLWMRGDESPTEAVESLIDLVAERLDLAPGLRLADIGCGYGGAARRLAARHHVHVTGLTLSTIQAAHAPPTAHVEILCRDWLANGLPDASFDRAYAIESTEHMADKGRFFAEAHRVLKPGGRLVVCAWLAAPAARPWERRHLLEPICREGRLPGMGTRQDYEALAQDAGFRLIAFEDISPRVARTWTICAARFARAFVTDPKVRRLALSARNRAFALSLPRLILAYRTRAMRYGVLTFAMPDAA